MHLLFVSNNFPPEVNAPATRIYEHARQWLRDGRSVEVLTGVPNFPEGVLYKGYRNRFSREEVDGIRICRVPMYIAENKGVVKRTLSYLSFMVSATCCSARLRQAPDVVVATSPQFFAALGGYVIARLRKVPFVLEIRDLWPESVVAVGALGRNPLIRFFESLARFLYHQADHLVVVTESFKRSISALGIAPEKITVLRNGADLEFYSRPLEPHRLGELRAQLGLEGKFVATYLGTVGMAHRADILLDAARACSDPDVVFMVVGTGAERAALEARARELALPNFRLVEKQPKELVPYILALSDVCVVHLRADPVFEQVIPSKIFEAMVMCKPVALGVRGEAAEIVESAGAGICFEPENVEALVEAVLRLRRDPELYARLGRQGFEAVREHHDRHAIARRYWSLLERVAASRRTTPGRNSPSSLN